MHFIIAISVVQLYKTQKLHIYTRARARTFILIHIYTQIHSYKAYLRGEIYTVKIIGIVIIKINIC